MTQVTLPKLSQSGTNEWADVEDNDKALRDVVNGSIDNTNLAAGTALANLAAASVIDAKLTSPNNSTYKTILHSSTTLINDAGAATYILLGGGGANIASGSNVVASPFPALPAIYFDDADYTVGSLTQKLRLRAQVFANATQPTITFTFGLYPITVAGAADTLGLTLGTVIASSTVAIASPAASTVTSGVNSDFTIPSDGAHMLGCVTSGTLTNNSAVVLQAQLQTRNV